MRKVQLNAAMRLVHSMNAAPAPTDADQDTKPEVSEWWLKLPAVQKKEYIEEHPQSKYADQAIKEGEEESRTGKDSTKPEISKQHRSKVSSAIRSKSAAIAGVLKKNFPLISEATSALKSIATGKPLTHEHREVLHELGGLALKTALSKAVGPEAAMITSRLGITAVKHAIDHYKSRNGKDEVQSFVEAVADGIDQAKEAPVPKEHQADGSHYRAAISKYLKKGTAHVVQVLDKSFQHIKPATQGLAALTSGKKMSDEQRTAVKSLGKIALGLSIASLPGGLAAHIAVGLGTTALKHAYTSIHRHNIDPVHVLHSFVESIGEGLEHGLLHHVGEGGHE